MNTRSRICKTIVLFIGGLLFAFSVGTTASKWGTEKTTARLDKAPSIRAETTLADHFDSTPGVGAETERMQEI